MPKVFNLLPNARHFKPFNLKEANKLHLSYTPVTMFCKKETVIAGNEFVYVEARELDEDAKIQLDSMADTDSIGPMKIFASLSSRGPSNGKFQEFLNQYRTSTQTLAELHTEFKLLDIGTSDYLQAEANIDLERQKAREAIIAIQLTITSYNEMSNYEWETATIPCDEAPK